MEKKMTTRHDGEKPRGDTGGGMANPEREE